MTNNHLYRIAESVLFNALFCSYSHDELSLTSAIQEQLNRIKAVNIRNVLSRLITLECTQKTALIFGITL